MGIKRAFRSSIGFTVHDVPSTHGDRSAAAAGTPGVRLPAFEVFDFGLSADGSVRSCAFPIAIVPVSIRSPLAATLVAVFRESQAIGCSRFLKSAAARVSGDHREVVVGRQLFAGDCVGPGRLWATLVARIAGEE
jgi:hypothetical protein